MGRLLAIGRAGVESLGCCEPTSSDHPDWGRRLGMLIETKLHAPVARKEWAERQELIDYLAGTTARLVLVDAPAGFGKTTLVAQWRSSASGGRSFAWVSLDRGDD